MYKYRIVYDEGNVYHTFKVERKKVKFSIFRKWENEIYCISLENAEEYIENQINEINRYCKNGSFIIKEYSTKDFKDE